MTRQEFYEECLLRTFKAAWYDPEHPMHDEVSDIDDIDSLGLNEILVKRDLKGFPEIPKKEDFGKWGVKYLCQLLGFVKSEKDCRFTEVFFSFLRKNKSLYGKTEDRKNLGAICWYALTDSIVENRDFCTNLASFMIFEFKGEEWFEKFLRVANALALLDNEAYDEYQRITQGKTILEAAAEIISSNRVRKQNQNGNKNEKQHQKDVQD